jgi:hypothetical protein
MRSARRCSFVAAIERGGQPRGFRLTALAVIAVIALAASFSPLVAGQVSGQDVLMHHYDAYRTGVQSHETRLTPANVGIKTFGKLFSMHTDGQVYAEPLWVGSYVMNDGKAHNVLFAATEHDSVYAFDGDGKAPELGYYWHVNLLGTGETTVPDADVYPGGGPDIVPEIGITGTPVIDRTAGVLYVVAKSKLVSGTNTTYIQRLHALSLSTGAEMMQGPITIAANVPGTALDGVNGVVAFNPLTNNQRSALTLADGSVWIAFASHGDTEPYHGWVIGYDASDLTKQTGVFNDTPNGGEGGIWMSGGGMSVDSSGNLYAVSGNGTFDANMSGGDYASTIFKFTPGASGLPLVTSFTPFDQMYLSNGDLDMGDGAAVLIDNATTGAKYPHLLVTAGKDGTIYLVDRDQMGGYMQNTNEDIQDFSNGGYYVHQSLTFFNNQLYLAADGGPLMTWTFDPATGLFNTNPATAPDSTFGCGGCDGAGAIASVSANGTSNGIVWVVDVSGYNSNPAVLHAFSANLATELYNSTWAANNRDQADHAVKFTTPTIANGFVYFGGGSSVNAYGLLDFAPPTTATPVLEPPPGGETAPVTVTITDKTPGAIIHYTLDGSTPSAASELYTKPIAIKATTEVQAMAIASGFLPGAIGGGTYLFGTPGDIFTFDKAFTVADLDLNGSATATPSRIELTDGGTEEAGSAYFHLPVKVTNFTVNFDFQMVNPQADGMTFVLQNQGSTALGPGGGGLGYGPGAPGGSGGISPSAAIKFDLYSNQGEGPDSTGFYTDGASPTTPAIDLTPYSIDLHSGHIFSVQLRYNGQELTELLTDTLTKRTFQKTYPVVLTKTLGARTARIGFTGGSGGYSVIADILNWSFTNPKIETLPATGLSAAVSGPALTPYAAASFPGGEGELFPATAVGQTVSFKVNAAAFATYGVILKADRGPNRGILQLYIDGKAYSSAVDNYSKTPVAMSVSYGFALLTEGTHTFEFKVTGKNAASTGYEATFGEIELEP